MIDYIEEKNRMLRGLAAGDRDGVDGFLAGKQFLIHDRDPLFTQEFRDILRAACVRCLKLPAHSPDLNAFAERFVLSIVSVAPTPP